MKRLFLHARDISKETASQLYPNKYKENPLYSWCLDIKKYGYKELIYKVPRISL